MDWINLAESMVQQELTQLVVQMQSIFISQLCCSHDRQRSHTYDITRVDNTSFKCAHDTRWLLQVFSWRERCQVQNNGISNTRTTSQLWGWSSCCCVIHTVVVIISWSKRMCKSKATSQNTVNITENNKKCAQHNGYSNSSKPLSHILHNSITSTWAIWTRGTGRPTVTTSAAVHGRKQYTSLPPSRSDSFEVKIPLSSCCDSNSTHCQHDLWLLSKMLANYGKQIHKQKQ